MNIETATTVKRLDSFNGGDTVLIDNEPYMVIGEMNATLEYTYSNSVGVVHLADGRLRFLDRARMVKPVKATMRIEQ